MSSKKGKEGWSDEDGEDGDKSMDSTDREENANFYGWEERSDLCDERAWINEHPLRWISPSRLQNGPGTINDGAV